MVHITALLMVKNESSRIRVSLKSLVGKVDRIAIHDTGSTDNTVGICERFGRSHNIDLRINTGKWVNFCVSRNESIEWVESMTTDWILFLDSNDELRLKNGKTLHEIAMESESVSELSRRGSDNENTTTRGPLVHGIYATQRLFMRSHQTTIDYVNIKLIRTGLGWRYESPVHEYLTGCAGQ